MEIENFFHLIRNKQFEEAHKAIDEDLASGMGDLNILNHRRVTVLLSEKRFDDALRYLQENREKCGSVTHAHETIAMIHELAGNDDLALIELESAPFSKEEHVYPLLVENARFYRLCFRIRRKLPISNQELDAFPPDYEIHLPANGHMRGVLIKKSDIVAMLQTR